ncbi:hypothetical protein DFS34DRAFT_597989 [Phlyctochytrium arcticum]|nr:hypothetical protein DFS34DRAFT_597989 [Phlyctochytrium arcticum]
MSRKYVAYIAKSLDVLVRPLDYARTPNATPSPSYSNFQSETSSIHTTASTSTAKSSGSQRKYPKFGKFLGAKSDHVITNSTLNHPPPAPAPPTSQCLAAARSTCTALGISPEELDRITHEALSWLTSQHIIADLKAYRFLLSQDMGFLSPLTIDNDRQYADWKAQEDEELEKIIGLANIMEEYPHVDSSHSKSDLYRLEVRQASGLYAKDDNGLSNPYCVVSFDGLCYVSDVAQSTLDPQWNLSMLITDLNPTMKIYITVWNRSSARPERRSDAFLGAATLDSTSLNSNSVSEIRLDLAKRSSRSHVSGHVLVKVEKLTPGMNDGNQWRESLRFIPPDPRTAYTSILQKLVERDASSNDSMSVLSESSQKLLNGLGSIWRLDAPFRAIVYLDCLTFKYTQGTLSASTLYDVAYRDVDKLTNSDVFIPPPDRQMFQDTSMSLSSLLNHQLEVFFAHPMDPSRGREIKAIASMLDGLQHNKYNNLSNAEFDVNAKRLIQRGITARYHSLHGIAHTAQESRYDGLIRLVQALRLELEAYMDNLDFILFGYVHVPDIAAKTFFDFAVSELNGYSRVFVAQPDLGDAFELYTEVKALWVTYERIDFNLAEKFSIQEWFSPFLKEWLTMSERKFIEWTQRAIEMDEFKHSNDMLISSSVLDIFTSFAQQVNFFKDLQWPDMDDRHSVLTRLLQDIAITIGVYGDTMVQSMPSDFHKFDVISQTAKTATLQNDNRKKLRLKLQVGKSKKLPPIDPSEIRVPSKSCVKINNLAVLSERFNALCGKSLMEQRAEQSPTGEAPNLPPKPSKHSLYTLARVPIRLTILHGERLTATRPYSIQVSIRVRVNNVDIGETRGIPQSSNAVWNDQFHVLIDESDINSTLELILMHRVPPEKVGDKERSYMFARGAVRVNWPSTHQVQTVDLNGAGSVLFRGDVSADNGNFLMEKVESSANRRINNAIEIFADKLCCDLHDRLKLVSRKYKSSGYKKFLGKLNTRDSPPMQRPASAIHISDDQIMQDLDTLLAYVNVNLEVLTENMDHPLALRIVKGIWIRAIRVVEGLVVGEVGDDGKEKREWDPRRIQFLRRCLEYLAAFFNSDGEGLPEEALQTPRYRQLCDLLNNYHVPRKDLQRDYMASDHSAGKFGDTEDDVFDGDWMLKLIRVKGGKDFVDDIIGRRVRMGGRPR